MERTVAITGTRSIGDAPTGGLAETFEAYLRPFAAAGAHFYVGGPPASTPPPCGGWRRTPMPR